MDAMFIQDPCPRLYGQAFEEFHSRIIAILHELDKFPFIRIFGSAPVKSMAETRRKARLIGQDSPGDVLISAAFAASNGPDIFGVPLNHG
ncbi:hypothetical protein LXL04_007941 [Taraxacum kok-saghyz]